MGPAGNEGAMGGGGVSSLKGSMETHTPMLLVASVPGVLGLHTAGLGIRPREWQSEKTPPLSLFQYL